MKDKKVLMIISVFIVIIAGLELTTHLFSSTIKGVPKGWNRELGVIKTDEDIKIPLPKGFKNAEVTNKINEGIVIEDKNGNQFVWVPASDKTFKRDNFGIDNTPLGYRIMLVEAKDKDIAWDVIKNPDLKVRNGGIWVPEEPMYQELLESVEKYDGFYMGRYEASYSSGKSIKDYIPSEVVSKIATEEDGAYEKDQLWNFVTANEAYAIAKNMYKDNSTVVSHLPYGIEWDTTMNWFIDTKNKTIEEVRDNSSSWGNTGIDTFSNTISLIKSGSFEETNANNIYDMAGNLFEWTREYFGKDECIINRGGHLRAYRDEIGMLSAGSRTWMTSGGNDQRFAAIGFRVALYIK